MVKGGKMKEIKKISKEKFILDNYIYTDRELRKIYGITDINYYRKKFGLDVPKRKKILFDDELPNQEVKDEKGNQ
jgi:hypothetical protein